MRDILVGAHEENVDQYLHFNYDKDSHTTTIDVYTHGDKDSSSHPDEHIVLANFDVTHYGDIGDDAHIAHELIKAGKLGIDG